MSDKVKKSVSQIRTRSTSEEYPLVSADVSYIEDISGHDIMICRRQHNLLRINIRAKHIPCPLLYIISCAPSIVRDVKLKSLTVKIIIQCFHYVSWSLTWLQYLIVTIELWYRRVLSALIYCAFSVVPRLIYWLIQYDFKVNYVIWLNI